MKRRGLNKAFTSEVRARGLPTLRNAGETSYGDISDHMFSISYCSRTFKNYLVTPYIRGPYRKS